MSASRLSLTLLALLAGSCAPPKDQFILSMTAKPKLVRDDGTPILITISAIDPSGNPGRGSVKVQSTAGSLLDGNTAQLDENGSGSIEFSCDLKQDPGCVDDLILTGSWLTSGYVITAELKVGTIVTDARASACSARNQKKLVLPASVPGNVKLGIADVMPPAEVHQLGLGAAEKGIAIWNATLGVGAIALLTPSQSASLTDEQARIRDLVGTTGTLSNPLERHFTTWDGNPAVRSAFELGGSDTLKARIDAISTKLAGFGTGLTGSVSKPPYKVVMTVSLRPGSQTSVNLAIAAGTAISDAVARELEDLGRRVFTRGGL